MQKVKLLGELSQFGAEWTVSCKSINDIFKLISCQSPTFKKYLIDCEQKGLDLEIIKGKRLLQQKEELFLNIENEDILISLCPSGGKNKFLKIVIGVTLAFYGAGLGEGFFANFVTGVGVNMALAGVTELLAPGPETDHTPLEADDFKDQLFNGPVNITKQGIPVPLLYGELVVGGAGIATDFDQVEAEATPVEEPIQATSFDHLIISGSTSIQGY